MTDKKYIVTVEYENWSVEVEAASRREAALIAAQKAWVDWAWGEITDDEPCFPLIVDGVPYDIHVDFYPTFDPVEIGAGD